jgi:hypothetical protein
MEDLQAVGVLKQEFEYRDISRAVLAKIDYKPLAGKTKYPFNLHLGQDRLEEVILSHLQRSPLSRRRRGCARGGRARRHPERRLPPAPLSKP